jgi:hypothetical protein
MRHYKICNSTGSTPDKSGKKKGEIMARIISINISEKKGTRKRPVMEAVINEDFGIVGDAHGGAWHRQISPPRD